MNVCQRRIQLIRHPMKKYEENVLKVLVNETLKLQLTENGSLKGKNL